MKNVLSERARRHGLEQDNVTTWSMWCDGQKRVMVWETSVRGVWSWLPDKPALRGAAPLYPSEELALEAALHWLDARYPHRRWSPSPGSQVGEAVRILRLTAEYLSHNTDPDHWHTEAAAGIREALFNLAGAVLPPRLEEGELLAVAWDYLCSSGELSPSALDAVARAVRRYPEIVARAQVAVWYPLRMLDHWSLLGIPRTGYHAQRGYADRLAEVWLDEAGGQRHWRWRCYGPTGTMVGESRDCAAARRACAELLSSWTVLELPEGPSEVPEAPKPTEVLDPADCLTCGGRGGNEVSACQECGSRGWSP